VEEDKCVYRTQDLESDRFLLLERLKRLCVYVDFEWFLLKRILYKRIEKLSVWQFAAAFDGQKLQKAKTNRGKCTARRSATSTDRPVAASAGSRDPAHSPVRQDERAAAADLRVVSPRGSRAQNWIGHLSSNRTTTATI
jgi:hypothetical protein